MKKFVFTLFAAMLIISTACSGSDTSSTENEVVDETQMLIELNDSLLAASAEKDSLLALLQEINAGMQQIKEIEKILSSPAYSADNPSQAESLKNDLNALQEALAARRKRIADLEAKLKKSSAYSEELQKTIDQMKSQIELQQTEINGLQEQLTQANATIEDLSQQVDSLSNVSDTERQLKEDAQQEAARLDSELNTCYYVIGTKSELKENNIIETGFLKKTKIMEGDYNKGYFTVTDRRTLSTIELHSTKAKILTNHASGSYSITEDSNGVKTLQITDVESFWEKSNYLVVQID